MTLVPPLLIDGRRAAAAPKRVAGTNPAANTEVSEIVPAGKYWFLFGIYIPLVQGLTQTPQPILVIDDGANVIFEGVGSSAAQAASTTCAYTWAPGLSLTGQIGTGANVRSNAALPAIVIGPGYRIRTITLGIGANTDYGVPSLYVAELS